MSLCKYAFYKDSEKYYPHLYCQIDDKWCHYVKRCERVEKFIPIEDNIWEECGKYIMEKRKEIPSGSYFVQTTRPNRQGNLFLYVLINDNKVEKILSNLTEINQDYVYLKKTNKGYEVSLEPFKKVTNKNNENITIHVNEELVTEKKKGQRKIKEYIPVVEIEPITKIEEDE